MSDCESGFKTYSCEGKLFITNRYKTYQDSSIYLSEAEEKAKQKIPARHKLYGALETLKFLGCSPYPTAPQKISSSSSSIPPNEECCGDKNQAKGDAQYSFGKSLTKAPYRAPIGGQPVGSGPVITRTYRFSYQAPDENKVKNIYENAKAFWESMLNDPNCCRIVSQYNNYGCTPECLSILTRRVNNMVRRLTDAYKYDWKKLASLCDVPWQSLLKNYPIHIYNKENTVIYDEVSEYETKWKTGWRCKQDDERPCCCNNECNCEKTCYDLNDCGENEGCIGHPECGYSPLGCCENNCTNKCTSNSQCTEEGETCKDGCCWKGNCRYGEWTPSPSTVCSGEKFVQTRPILNGSLEECPEEEREEFGIKDCSPCATSNYRCTGDGDCLGKPVGPDGQERDGTCVDGCCVFPEEQCFKCCSDIGMAPTNGPEEDAKIKECESQGKEWYKSNQISCTGYPNCECIGCTAPSVECAECCSDRGYQYGAEARATCISQGKVISYAYQDNCINSQGNPGQKCSCFECVDASTTSSIGFKDIETILNVLHNSI